MVPSLPLLSCLSSVSVKKTQIEKIVYIYIYLIYKYIHITTVGESQKQSTLNFLKDERFSPPWSGGKKCIGNLGINILGGVINHWYTERSATCKVNPFYTSGLFVCPLKTSGNHNFYVFRGKNRDQWHEVGS